ncbi:hypothetical protein Emed_005039 [Eimeria media]
MEKPPKVVPEKCRGFLVSEDEREVTTRDCILYALGTAACQDPLDEEDLRYCYEGSSLGFAVLPTFATTLMPVASIFEGLDKCPGLPSFNPMKLLHGEHKLTLLRPLHPDTKVRSRTVIRDVLDKRSGALVALRVETFEGNDLLCINDFQLFIRGIGGFGGPSTSAASIASPEFPTGAPEKTMEALTQANLALIYRLSSSNTNSSSSSSTKDSSSSKADVGLAQMGGFSKPILHGLCTLGIATRHRYDGSPERFVLLRISLVLPLLLLALGLPLMLLLPLLLLLFDFIIKEVLGGDPSRVASVSCRFTNPTTPGDRLRVSVYDGDNSSSSISSSNNNKSCTLWLLL